MNATIAAMSKQASETTRELSAEEFDLVVGGTPTAKPKGGNPPQEYLVITLTDVLVTGVSWRP